MEYDDPGLDVRAPGVHVSTCLKTKRLLKKGRTFNQVETQVLKTQVLSTRGQADVNLRRPPDLDGWSSSSPPPSAAARREGHTPPPQCEEKNLSLFLLPAPLLVGSCDAHVSRFGESAFLFGIPHHITLHGTPASPFELRWACPRLRRFLEACPATCVGCIASACT